MQRSKKTFMASDQASPMDLMHVPAFPADVREGELICAQLHRPSAANPARSDNMRIWRISPFGVELLHEASSDAPPPVQGEHVDLDLKVGQQNLHFSGLIVDACHTEHDRKLIGIRFQPTPRPRPTNHEQRSGTRWACSRVFYPTGIAANPARYNDKIYFSVVDFSGGGMRFTTSLRNKHILPQMHLHASLVFPAIGQVDVDFTVKFTERSKSGDNQLLVGAKLDPLDAHAQFVIGQYLLQFGEDEQGAPSPQQLKKAGFRVSSTTKTIDFHFVRTESEYQKVLELRLKAYKGAGKVADCSQAQDMSDVFDSRARILTGVYRNSIVASMRLIYNSDDEQSEHEQFLTLPGTFPKKHECVEITRVCTDPAYRGGDLLHGLFKHCMLTIIQSGRRYLIGCATKKLLPIYTRIGCKSTGVTFRHPHIGNEEHTIFVADLYSGMAGVGIDPITWNILFSELWQYVDPNIVKQAFRLAPLRATSYRLLEPVSRLVAKRLLRPRERPTQRPGTDGASVQR